MCFNVDVQVYGSMDPRIKPRLRYLLTCGNRCGRDHCFLRIGDHSSTSAAVHSSQDSISIVPRESGSRARDRDRDRVRT